MRKGARHTLDCALVVAKNLIERLCLTCREKRNEQYVVIYAYHEPKSAPWMVGDNRSRAGTDLGNSRQC